MRIGLTHHRFIQFLCTLAFCVFFRQVSSQDNKPPTFSHTQYIFSVYENAAIGTPLTPTNPTTGIMATDLEDTVIYRKVDNTASLEITLNSVDGVLTVGDNLDREMIGSYSFDITADDGQRGSNFLPVVTVQIVVLDINDHAPQFVNEPYSYTIEEGVSNNHQVNPSYGKISVTDEDIGNNQPSVFSIVSGHDDKFAIDQNGIITTTLDDSVGVNKIIDFETKFAYTLVVRATNVEDGPSGSVFSETSVTIDVLNINDEDPIFEASSSDQTISVLESTTGVIMTMVAMDTDGTLSVLTTFTYSIVYGNNLINGLHSFAIDPTTGVVTVDVNGLDHETHEEYTLVIQAEENQSPKSSVLTSLTILIEDVNESPPVFTPAAYAATISETSDITSAILLVSAEDSEPAHTVIYTLDGTADSLKFSINNPSGLLTLIESLDRDSKVSYTFNVIAMDDDPNPLSATAQIVITVSDENDNSPIFTDSAQTTDVDELITALPFILYDVVSKNLVTDEDTGLNSEVKYSFQTGDSAFSINPDSGVISVVAVLDHNLKSKYELTIIATDQASLASERRSGSFVLTINVNDMNDNPPVLVSIGGQTVEENLPMGTIVFTISATDVDDGLSTSLSFSPLGTTLPFTININTLTQSPTFVSADVVTTRPIDFETTSDKSFSLNIEVTDGFNAVFEIVVVTTQDVNDNSPIFSDPAGYTFDVNEVETGTIIGSVSATDLDSSIFGPITYEKTGDNDGYFKLDTNTGEISIQVGLDAESFLTYQFSIVAFDSGLPPLSNIVLVTISVNDINDNAPIFLISDVEVSINENTVVTSIFTFQAIDLDETSPNNQIKYFIVDSFPVVVNLDSLFLIGEDSGTIGTGTSLPIRSDFTQITLTIEARDLGSPTMTAVATITIVINDVNDNTPNFEFPSYNVNVDEDFSTSETLIQVQAFENPEDANTQIVYSLQAASPPVGDSLSFVTIDSGTGVITAAKSLDSETQPLLSLNIIASDGLLESSAILTITVGNINDNTPTISISSACTQSILEDVPLMNTICTFDVMDADGVSDAEFGLKDSGFSISPSDTEFEILYTDGDTSAYLIFTSSLDFESVKSYLLFITIVDRGRPSTRSATLSLPLTVIGTNEHAPVFSLPEYTFYMDETEEIGSVIGKVTATDADDYSTSDGVFSYSPVDLSPFTLDPSSGLIILNAKVDYEQDTEFNFAVYAIDNVGGTQLTGTTTVTVVVEDTNEHQPVFLSSPSGVISENIGADDSVLQVQASDADMDGVISYSIIGGNTDGVFRIDASSGEIFTTNVSPDFEAFSSYTLIILADDNAMNPRQASLAVPITVLDINDNSPVFDRPPVDSLVDESMGSFIMLVSATDLDSTTNAELTYSNSLPTEFYIDPNTGVLTTNMPLDREVTTSYSLEICATDGGSPSLSVCQLVTITIVDENDNVPVFVASSITTVDVPENTNGGQLVSTFEVTDEDENPTFFFTLLDGGGPFSISSSGATATVIISGDSTLTPLDRETIASYTLTVTVTDGDASHTSSHDFVVVIIDVNDQFPLIEKDTYILSTPLPEDSIDGFLVLIIVAIDNDISPNNDISFSLLESAEDRFRVDSTGNILVNIQPGGSILDYEFSTSHTLIVESSDGTLKDTSTIYIPVGDVNDNTPIFLETSYSIGVLETTAIGTTILAVQAIDADSGANGIVKYSIEITDGTFFLNEASGILTTSISLDAELGPTEYALIIIAKDSSTIPLSSSVPVTITVVPEIEDIPVFDQSLYQGSVDEGVATLANIVTISATASDSTAVISYDIVDPAAKFYFSVGPSDGIISLINPLDREEFEDFTFTVVASDSEAFPRQGFSIVKIIIGDTNDNSPEFLLGIYSVSISETTTGTIITTSATDSDATVPFNTIEYEISNAALLPFSINQLTGQISVSGSLDFDEGPKSYSISIIADDGSLTGVTTLNIQITDVNDIAPIITNSDLSLTISESTPGGTEVFDINVQDIDTVGIITYQITSGNTLTSFIIDSSGIITISAVGLDFESVPSFTLGIQVSDGSQMISSILMITITDVNDHTPTFNQPQYSVSISEDNFIDTVVLTFTVDDPDTGDDGVVSVFIDSASNIVNMFKLGTISSNTFMILSAIPLDRETSGLSIDNSFGAAKWILKLIAYDNNIIVTNRLTSTAEVLINLLDVNDNAPNFFSSSFSAQISESSNIGTLVISLTATDPDFGTNAEISYEISASSSNAGKFTLDSITGELRTNEVLSRESSQLLVLDVEATDGSLKDTAIVTIAVTDINDHNPEFSVNVVTASIPEDSSAGTSVAVVSASDSDDGDNGRITIFIIGGDPRSQFKVNNGNSATVEIQVAKNDLDRETQSNYELILAARDHGTPTRQGTSTVTITLTDINDNSPIFSPSQYFGTISEDETAGIFVELNTPIVFSDADEGINSQVTLSLDDNVVFSISSLGVVSLNMNNGLDREVIPFYEIHIVAIDMGANPLTSSATLTISVEDVNDNEPIFTQLPYSASLAEDVSIGTPVLTVIASDIDSGANMEISYRVFSNSQGNFEVDVVSGLIKTTSSLDREQTDMYNLVIVAFDSGSPFMSSTATVSIAILDVNDNVPIFSQSLYTGNVDENTLVFVVVILDASDLDLNQNSELIFEYQDLIAGSALPFTIDSSSGEISVSGILDRESTDIYTFQVVVHDNSISNQLTATAVVVISINDLNDVKPCFSGVDSLRTSLQETTRITTIILSPTATDPDLGDGGEVVYSLSPSSTIFSVNEATGEIQLLEPLDIDSNGPNGFSEYVFDLVATDKGTPPLSCSISVVITILNENDNVPIFDSSLYTVSIREDIDVGTSIINLTATDNDISGTIKYDIVGGNLDLLFSIDEDTGEVSNRLPLLSLASNIFELTVRAYESGDNTKSSLTSLHIEISDTNDNAPSFCQTADYRFSVSENSVITTTVGQICGTDRDSGINGKFTFMISSGNDNDAFDIDQVSGSSTAYIIVKNDVLDREADDEYILVLLITDNGSPQLQSSPILAIISILDVNDEIPVIFNLPISIDLPENTFGGVIIYQVNGSDSDISVNADIFFEIIDGNTLNLFRIETETGQISVIDSLDFNMQNSFTLTIRVSDKGIIALSSQSTISITIIDVNDHAPEFMPPYFQSISEDLTINSFVISVLATDLDATTNAELIYSISSGVNAIHFAIDNTNGDIALNTTLDREVQSSYILEVTACDMGIPIMCNSVGVIIQINDVNDHEPIFNPPEYSFTVLEDSSADFKIGKVIASDLDDGVNGGIQYSIEITNLLFRIDPDSGDIFVKGELDRESTDFYQLTIRVEDMGVPPQFTTVTVNITVLDVNDNSPIIDISLFSAQISEDAAFGLLVFDVDATDSDTGTNSKITLSILGGNFDDFFIIPDSGKVHVNGSLSAERISTYELLIQASDSSDPPLTDIETLIITIIDVNEFPPKFEQEIYFVDLLENASPGTVVTTVTAIDADVQGTVNSKISFFIPFPYSTDFAIDPVSGLVTTKITFDREDSSSQVLVVMASNSDTIPVLQGSAQIQITLIDENDEIPYFINLPSNIQISELSSIGLIVLVLEAYDADDSNLGNGRVSFSSASENSAEFDRSFYVNSNGFIEVNGILDREIQAIYSAVVVVQDEGSPSLSSKASIVIELLDENDTPPLFTNSTYSISYSEDLDSSSQNGLSRLLLTLNFSDGDSDISNQESTYRLAANSPFSNPDFSVTDGGEVFVNIGLDREVRDTYTVILEVINMAIGLGSFCNPLDSTRALIDGGECKLYSNATVVITITDINDNTPVFSLTPYFFAIMDTALFNSEVGFIHASDSDLSVFGQVIYSLTGTSDFIIDDSTGLIKTNVIFSGRLGQILVFSATASDLSNVSPKSSSETIFVSVLNYQFLVQIVVDQTIDKTQLCLSQLVSKLVEITNFQIYVLEVREHVVGFVVSPLQTDVLIYAFQLLEDSFSLVSQTELIRKIDENFDDLADICDGKVDRISLVPSPSVAERESSNIQIILIIIVCLILLLCGLCANFLALYQRILGKRSLQRSEEYIYGGMEGLDVLTTTQQGLALNQNPLLSDTFLNGELTYESQELKMDLFLDEIPEEEYISASDFGSSVNGVSLPGTNFGLPTQDDQDISISSI